MKKIFVLTLAVVIMSTLLAGQEKPAEPLTRKGLNSVYVEVLGNALILSLNYEKMLTDTLGVRVGGMALPLDDKFGGAGTAMVTGLWGDGNFCLEMGLGVMALIGVNTGFLGDDNRSSLFAVTGTIGVRYQPKLKGLVLRLGFTPFLVSDGAGPWVGASIGYSFR